MFSWQIDELMKYRNYLITIQDYITICKTSPQIYLYEYNGLEDKYHFKTDDKYEWYFKVKK